MVITVWKLNFGSYYKIPSMDDALLAAFLNRVWGNLLILPQNIEVKADAGLKSREQKTKVKWEKMVLTSSILRLILLNNWSSWQLSAWRLSGSSKSLPWLLAALAALELELLFLPIPLPREAILPL